MRFRLSTFFLGLAVCLIAVPSLTACDSPAPVDSVPAENGTDSQPENSEPAEETMSPEEFQKQLMTQQEERMSYFKRGVEENQKEAMALMKQGKLDKAENMLIVALKQLEQYKGQTVREAIIVNNLASIYEQKEMYAQAIPLYSRAQKLFIRAYGRDYPAVSMVLSSLGRVLGKQARWYEAAAVYRTAVELMDGNKDVDPAAYKETLEAYIKALRITGEGQRLATMEKKLHELDSAARSAAPAAKSEERSKTETR